MRLNLRLFSPVRQKRPFYVTSPIFYVNAAPHIGHLYSAVVTDAVQRFEKLINPDINVKFCTGTDEHGTKIQQAASYNKMPLPDYCTKISKEYLDMCKEYNIQHTDFIRTTEDRHKKAVEHFWNKLAKEDYIYKANYEGWYSVNDETFVPESQLKDEVRDGEKIKVSLESGHKVEWTEESNYMFRLSAFKTHLQDWLKTDGVITPSKFQRQLQDYLAKETYFPDISVSRPASRVHWAIRVPGDDTQSVYVWLDALVSYLTGAGYPLANQRWPPDLHVIGKDILKFHGIYWPAFLMAARLHPPRRILCHAHWTVQDSKMSKSRGNVVSPRAHAAGPEALRYFLLREHTQHSDANYSWDKLLRTINAELADSLGNLVSRCCGAALNPRQEFPAPRLASAAINAADLRDTVERLPDVCREHYSEYRFYKVVDSVIQAIHQANLYFETQKPWELRKNIEKQPELDTILHITMETLRVCGIILQPIIPEMATRLLDKLQVPKEERLWEHCERISWMTGDLIQEDRKIQDGKFVLFQRIYTEKAKKSASL